MLSEKPADAVRDAVSVTVTETPNVPPTVGVPLNVPPLIPMPGGSPVADHE